MRTILMSALWLQFSCGPAGSDFYCPSCPCENDTRKYWILHQTVQISFQNFPTHLPKVLPLLTTNLTRTKNLPKKIQQGSYFEKKPTSHFNFVWNFFPFCLALLIRMPSYRKVQLGKRRWHGWMHEGSKIMRIIFWIVLDEISWTTFLWCPQFFFSPKNGFFLLQNCLFGKKVTDWIKLEYMMKTFSAIFCKKKFCEYHKYRRIFFFCTGPPLKKMILFGET